MRNRTGRVGGTVRGVQGFLGKYATLIGPSVAPSRRSLDDVEAVLTTHAEVQAASFDASRGETSRQRALRATLRNNHMKPIAEVARLKLRDVPEFSSLTMPAPKITAAALVSKATSMHDAAAGHEAVFKDVGLPDDFLAALKAASDALTASITQRNDLIARRVGATAGLAAEEKRAMSIIRVIDAIVRPTLGSDDALLHEWDAAKHVPRKPGVTSGTGTGTPGSATSGTGTTPTAPATTTSAPSATPA